MYQFSKNVRKLTVDIFCFSVPDFWIFGCSPGGRTLSRGGGGAICCRSRIIWKDIGLGVGGSAERELRTSSTLSQYYGAVKKSLIKKNHLKCVTNLFHHFLGVALTDFRYHVFFHTAAYFGTDALHVRALFFV